MNRFSRISTIWRKEFADTLRDRRTVIAMVLVPMVVYPVLMLGSLQAFELQVSRLKQEEYTVAVRTPEVADWLRRRILDPDPARHAAAADRPAEEMPAAVEARAREEQLSHTGTAREAARSDVRHEPPPYAVKVVPDLRQAVASGQAHVGVRVGGGPMPTPDSPGSVTVTLVVDGSNIRSQIAAAALEAVFERVSQQKVMRRLKDLGLTEEFIRPLVLAQDDVASAQKIGGSGIGPIVALMLVIMTITGAIYPAIDLTAGERERGTLETLMAAPVPKVDLIAGKFVVVASIGMLSALLNLLSIGGTIYLGGLGNLLTRGVPLSIPLHTLPLVLVVLVPLAVMFSALLLAVCSFARSFKEAQNYVMPVLMVCLIPAVIGVLPGTELEGPLLILPVTNIVILTRDLFMGQIEPVAILWVTLSTCVYASAAVAVAARLFGQEAVLFADSASLRTLLQRRLFKPSAAPTLAQALLLLAIVYSANFFVQQSMLKAGLTPGSPEHLALLALTLVTLFAGLPIAAALYLKVRVTPALGLVRPPPAGMASGLCVGASTWILALAWGALQERVLPLPPDFVEAARPLEEQLRTLPVVTAVFFVALVPALCEELFFRGYALAGLRGTLGNAGAALATAAAFAVAHYSVYRLAITFLLGLVLALLVLRWGSIWPAVLAHMLHNTLLVLAAREDGLRPWLERWQFVTAGGEEVFPPPLWLAAAAAVLVAGLVLTALAPGARAAPAGQPAVGKAAGR